MRKYVSGNSRKLTVFCASDFENNYRELELKIKDKTLLDEISDGLVNKKYNMYRKNRVRLELKADVTINYMNRKQFLESVEHL